MMNGKMQRQHVKMDEQMETSQPEGLSEVLEAQLFS